MKYRFFNLILIFLLWSVLLNAQERRIQENGKTYLIHVVEKGETIFSLSKTYSVDRRELLNANPDLIFGLKTGQELKIPVDETHSEEVKVATSQEQLPSFHSYQVKRRDALHFIAKRFDVEVEDILKYNPELKEEGLHKRMILKIPDAGDLKRIRQMEAQTAEKETVKPGVKQKQRTHRVVGDETLYALSKKYNRSIASLLEANPEAKNGLQIGMELIIPEDEEVTERAPEAAHGFFTHLVETGETFWSLERKYHVTRDVLERYNPVLKNGLLAGLQIKIPVSPDLPDIQSEAVDEQAFDKHRVKMGETLYSLSSQYQVKINELKKLNPVLSYRGLMAGETILIPKEKDQVITENETQIEEVAEPEKPTTDHAVKIVSLEVPENCKPLFIPSNKKYDVALLLPLYLNANDRVNRVPMTREQILLDSGLDREDESGADFPADTFKLRENEIIDPRSENFIHFYEGVLLAVDSLQRAGMNIELHVFDTNKEQAVVDSIVHLDVFREMELIIGPVFPNLQASVASFAYKNRIPMVSPLSAAGNFEEKNPWYFKVNPTKDFLVRQTADYIGDEYLNQNFIVLQMGEYRHLPEATLVDLCREKFFSAGHNNSGGEVLFHEYDFQTEGYLGLRRMMRRDRQNVIIIPSATEAQVSVAASNINSLSEDYPVAWVGLSNLQRFRSIQTEYFHHVDMHLLSPYYVDYKSKLTNNFIRKFRQNFAAEPNQFSFQGYDVAFYFMSAMSQYGKDFFDCLPYHQASLNQGRFYFDKVNRYGGFMNQGLFVVNYKKNYEVAVDGMEGAPSIVLSDR